MFTPKKLPIELNGMEVFYLENRVKNTDISEGLPDKDDYRPQGRDLALLLGGLFNEFFATNADSPVIAEGSRTIYLTKEQVWVLRSKVGSTDVGYDQKTNVGIPLLIKLYRLLLQFEADLDEWEPVQIGYEDMVADEELVEKFKEHYDANRSSD